MTGPDVVVIGGGSAGLAAAVAAAEAGAEVVVLERSTRDEAGGNARFSHTGFRMPYTSAAEIHAFLPDVSPETLERLVLPGDPPAAFAADLDRTTAGRMDAALRDTLAEGAGPALRWMHGLGIEWGLNRHVEIDGRLHFPPGLVLAAGGDRGGPALVARWLEIAADHGVMVSYEARVLDMELRAGRVVAVTVAEDGRDDGPASRLEPAAVVVASGGFQASPALRQRYLGPAYGAAVVRGSALDTGELLERLIEHGAGRAGSWDEAVTSPVDAASPPVAGGNDLNRYSYPYGITVDRAGQRFFDEGADHMSNTYGHVGRAILARPGGRAFQIFDQQGLPFIKTYAYRHARSIEATTLAGLAAGMGIDAAVFERTVADYNAAVRDDRPFDPTTLDGRHTTGLGTPKSNWAVALTAPPFVAYGVTGGLTFTLGGLAIDPSARVLDAEGAPIGGLYANGDVLGLFYGDYPSGAGQTRNAVFGRLAGAGAAAWALAHRP